MNKEVIQKAIQSAEQEIEDKQVEKIKTIVKDTLQKIRDIDDEIKELEDDRKILKLDIDNLKEGRLDRIEERQKVNKKAKKISVIIVEKEVHHHHYDRWYEPYKITYMPYYPPVQPLPISPIFYNDNIHCCTTTGQSGVSATISACDVFSLSNSIAKNFTVGTYPINGEIVNLT